jgi:phage terminase large subunit-like protein
VASLADLLELPLMPWQRRVLDVALEYDEADGRFFYREVRLTVPRQSGKTVLLLMLMVHRCLAMGGNRRVAMTMQDGQSAKKKMFNDFLPLLLGSELREFFTTRRSNGDEAFNWNNGSMWFPLSTSETAGHGLTLDLGVIDEAFDNDGRSEQAMTPAMMTKRDAQLWVVSTMGTTEDEWFNAKVAGGRSAVERGRTEGVCYLEWSAEPGADPGSEDTWRACMPALGHTVDVATIRAIYESMPLAEFMRAFLNIPVNRQASAPWRVVAEHQWSARESREWDIADDSPVFLGVDTKRDRSVTSLVIAGLNEVGLPQVEFVDGRGGTAWVVDRVVGISRRFPTFRGAVIDSGSAAATFIEPLRAAGVEVVDINGGTHADYAQRFFDAVVDGGIVHRGQLTLTGAVADAVKRNFGDRWLWNRRAEGSDISALVSATLAFGALTAQSVVAEVKPVFAY